MWTSEALFLLQTIRLEYRRFVTWLINKEITRHGWTREKKSVFYFFSFIRTFFFAVLSHLLLILCLWWWRSSHYDFDHVIRIFFFQSFQSITSPLSDICSHFSMLITKKLLRTYEMWQVNHTNWGSAVWCMSDWSVDF